MRRSGCPNKVGLFGLFLFLFVSLPSSETLAGSEVAWTLSDLEIALAGELHERMAFVEERHIALLEAPIHLEGFLLYLPPERIEKHVTMPIEESFVIDGNQVFITEADGTEHSFGRASHPLLFGFSTTLFAILKGDFSPVQRTFYLELSGTAESWKLRFFPREASLKTALTEIQVLGAWGTIGSLETTEPDGSRTVIALQPAQ